jgi:hypothetical protein
MKIRYFRLRDTDLQIIVMVSILLLSVAKLEKLTLANTVPSTDLVSEIFLLKRIQPKHTTLSIRPRNTAKRHSHYPDGLTGSNPSVTLEIEVGAE